VRLTTRSTVALTTAIATAVGLGLSLMSPIATAAPQARTQTTSAERSAAEAALVAVEQALDPAVTERSRAVQPRRDLTLLLNDLFVALPDLSTSDRRTAQRYLARPTDPGGDGLPGLTIDYANGVTVQDDCGSGEPGQGTDFCVNWLNSTNDAPSTADTNGTADSDGIPDWIENVRTDMADVWDVEVDEMGFKPPLNDNKGPNNKLDIYIADIGDPGYYGYCTSERRVSGGWAASGYCVLDDDYAPSEFGPANTPRENLQVTAAHEFFHAVQFAYDFDEDNWFMEGTAAWMEDEVYDNVNDNYQYLNSSPISNPKRPLDHSASIGVYGSWIWWRYLTEATGWSGLVHAVWNRADDSDHPAGNHYSMQALDKVLKSQDESLKNRFNHFGVVNRAPGTFYEEGEDYLSSKAADSFALTSSDKTSGPQSRTIDHMASATIVVRPGSGLGDTGWQLKVNVDGPPSSRSPFARAVAYNIDGDPVQSKVIKLKKNGAGSAKVGFSSADVDRVDVTLTNAGHAYKCWERTQFSCAGKPKDDNLKFDYRLTAVAP